MSCLYGAYPGSRAFSLLGKVLTTTQCLHNGEVHGSPLTDAICHSTPPSPSQPAGVAGLCPGSYRYTDDLLQLEAISQGREPVSQPPLTVSGFLPLDAWAPFLASHPDQRYAACMCQGILYGFRVGFNPASSIRAAAANMRSALDLAEIVQQMIESKVTHGRLAIAPSPLGTHTSPLGLIPKPHQPGKFRLIVDLSAPHGSSVNDGIDPSLCSLEYATVDQAAILARQTGPGALMSKLDRSSAYRRVPVHSPAG